MLYGVLFCFWAAPKDRPLFLKSLVAPAGERIAGTVAARSLRGLRSSFAREMVGARKVTNWTKSLEKSRSSVQSKATLSFSSNRGNLLR